MSLCSNQDIVALSNKILSRREKDELVSQTHEKPCAIFGRDIIEDGAVEQIKVTACLPVTVKTALMPDSHSGKGNSVGGVVACRDVILSHSGSRGFGAKVASYYNKIALDCLDNRLVDRFRDLPWLYMDSSEGREYYDLMNLAGRYASACHDIIHRSIIDAIGCDTLDMIENFHNFAWYEDVGGEMLYVHRKGATPAHVGVRGIIPGTMADDCHIVVGLGNTESINSSSHGDGRAMSRTIAKKTLPDRNYWEKYLKDRGVDLISADIDEMPSAYKPISEVMSRQTGLVRSIGVYNSRIVKMSNDGTHEG